MTLTSPESSGLEVELAELVDQAGTIEHKELAVTVLVELVNYLDEKKSIEEIRELVHERHPGKYTRQHIASMMNQLTECKLCTQSENKYSLSHSLKHYLE